MNQILLKNFNKDGVFSVLIKWKRNLYYTGYYYDENGDDYLFNDLKNIECFKTVDELVGFCNTNGLRLNNDLAVYDFDTIPKNPIDYRDVLNKWNLLDTISSNLNLAFEGSEHKYDKVYNYLFSCCFAKEPLPTLYKIPKSYFRLITYVLNKQTEQLDRLHYINYNK